MRVLPEQTILYLVVVLLTRWLYKVFKHIEDRGVNCLFSRLFLLISSSKTEYSVRIVETTIGDTYLLETKLIRPCFENWPSDNDRLMLVLGAKHWPRALLSQSNETDGIGNAVYYHVVTPYCWAYFIYARWRFGLIIKVESNV